MRAVTARWRRTISDVLVLNPFGLLVDQRRDLASVGFKDSCQILTQACDLDDKPGSMPLS